MIFGKNTEQGCKFTEFSYKSKPDVGGVFAGGLP